MPTHTDLYPRLIVDEPDAALEFYERALGADIISRFADREQRVVHAAFSVGDAVVSLAECVPEWGLHSPRPPAEPDAQNSSILRPRGAGTRSLSGSVQMRSIRVVLPSAYSQTSCSPSR